MRKPVKDNSTVDYALASGGFLLGFMHIFLAFIAFFRSFTESFTHLIIGVCLISCGWSLIKYELVKDGKNVIVASIYIIQVAVRFYADIDAYWGTIDIIAVVSRNCCNFVAALYPTAITLRPSLNTFYQ